MRRSPFAQCFGRGIRKASTHCYAAYAISVTQATAHLQSILGDALTPLHLDAVMPMLNRLAQNPIILKKATSARDKDLGISVDDLAGHFNISFKEDADESLPNFDANYSDNEWLNYNFPADEIKAELPKLKLGKACGIDLIRNEMLKNAPGEFVDVIVRLLM